MRALELKVPPPIVALVLALLMWLTPAVAGLVPISHPARVLSAVVLVCVGQGIGMAGMIAFRRGKTTVNPVKASLASSLVIRGVYRYTRNPMYVGLLLTLLAWALFLANPLAVLWVVAYVLYITRFQIIPEDVYWGLSSGRSTRLTKAGYADGYEPWRTQRTEQAVGFLDQAGL